MTTTNEALRSTLIQAAEKQVAQYPQYAGHFSGYILGRARRTIRTKGGVVATRGEVVLVKPEIVKIDGVRTITFWSNQKGWDVGVSPASVEAI